MAKKTLPDAHSQASEYPEAKKMALKLQLALFGTRHQIRLIDVDYCHWMEPRGKYGANAYRRFDVAVKHHLGRKLYKAAEQAARLPEVLAISLGIVAYTPKHERALARAIIKGAA